MFTATVVGEIQAAQGVDSADPPPSHAILGPGIPHVSASTVPLSDRSQARMQASKPLCLNRLHPHNSRVCLQDKVCTKETNEWMPKTPGYLEKEKENAANLGYTR
jgi:hypothetical protein